MGVGELRANVVHIVGHAAQNGVSHRFCGIAALGFVTPQFLYPLQIDDRHHTDQQIGMLGNIDLRGDHRAMQAFIKQQIGAAGHIFPRRESARVLFVGCGLFVVVQVFAPFACARFAIGAKQGFKL